MKLNMDVQNKASINKVIDWCRSSEVLQTMKS